MNSTFSVRNKSLTYNRSIIGLSLSSLEKILESSLLSVKPRAISKLYIMSYHVEPQDILQSLPLKRSIILPLSFILYALKHSVPDWQVTSSTTTIICIHLGSLDTKIFYRLSSSTLYQRFRYSSSSSCMCYPMGVFWARTRPYFIFTHDSSCHVYL